MKKIYCILFSILILITSSFIAISASATMGDVNSDNKINSQDALLILKYSVGSEIPSNFDYDTADLNTDEIINSSDALIVLKISVGLLEPSTITREDISITNISTTEPSTIITTVKTTTKPTTTTYYNDVVIISGTVTMSDNVVINSDIYITSSGRVTFNNVIVNGDIYCYGQLKCNGCTANNVYAYAYGSMFSCGAFDGIHGQISGNISCNKMIILDNSLDYAFNKWGKQ